MERGVQDHIPDTPTFTAQPGLQVPLGENPQAIDFFHLFLDNELIDLLVEQTNICPSVFTATSMKSKT